MTRPGLAIASALLCLMPWTGARAQVTVDVAKITCDQFTLFKLTDPQNIAIWLSGYYNAKHNNTVIDTEQFKANTKKLTTYCMLKPQETVMQAVEAVFGEKK